MLREDSLDEILGGHRRVARWRLDGGEDQPPGHRRDPCENQVVRQPAPASRWPPRPIGRALGAGLRAVFLLHGVDAVLPRIPGPDRHKLFPFKNMSAFNLPAGPALSVPWPSPAISPAHDGRVVVGRGAGWE